MLQTPPTTRKGDMVYRTLGKTGEPVSLIGLGGYHVGVQKTEDDSVRLIRSAIDRGITFLDNCWDYNGGASEVRMGKALQNGYRSKVFLMTKIDGRTKAAAAQQIDESLKRLQTDRIDLVQIHEIIRMEDPDRVFAKGGAMEALREAKQAGKLRFIGFTGHKDPKIHLHMLDTADRNGFRFDTVQMPLNVLDAHFRSFGANVVPRLVKDQIGVLGMKTFGGQFIYDKIVAGGIATPIELLHYSMTLPTSVVITGMDRTALLDQAIEAAKTFKPLTADQVATLLAKTKAAAAGGGYEKFKTTTMFDGTTHNPQWMG
jgi:aryl-alcohol dehydrogenase-like predicted oxidoreductase